MNRRFDAAIFDLDGVLVDTAKFHYLAWKELADSLGVPFDIKKNERLKGVSRMESLKIILEDETRDFGDLEALATRKNDRYVEMIKQITSEDVLPGVIELLTYLRSIGVKTGVASASKNAMPVLEGLNIMHLLDAVTDGTEVQNTKPAPDVFLKCAEKLGIEPKRCVVVEDAQAGIDAANAAGMFAVALSKDNSITGADMSYMETKDIEYSIWE